VEALRIAEKPRLQAEPETAGDPARARKGARDVWLRPFGAFATQVYDFDGLGPGSRLAGPALIERRDTTVFIPPAFAARVDAYRNVRIRRCLTPRPIGGEGEGEGA